MWLEQSEGSGEEEERLRRQAGHGACRPHRSYIGEVLDFCLDLMGSHWTVVISEEP